MIIKKEHLYLRKIFKGRATWSPHKVEAITFNDRFLAQRRAREFGGEVHD